MSIFIKRSRKKVEKRDLNDPEVCRQDIACMNQVDVMRCVLSNSVLVGAVKEWISWLESLYGFLPYLKTVEREKKLESLQNIVAYAEGKRDWYM